MPTKQLSFTEEARKKIRRGVDKVAEGLKARLGLPSRTVSLQPLEVIVGPIVAAGGLIPGAPPQF